MYVPKNKIPPAAAAEFAFAKNVEIIQQYDIVQIAYKSRKTKIQEGSELSKTAPLPV